MVKCFHAGERQHSEGERRGRRRRPDEAGLCHARALLSSRDAPLDTGLLQTGSAALRAAETLWEQQTPTSRTAPSSRGTRSGKRTALGHDLPCLEGKLPRGAVLTRSALALGNQSGSSLLMEQNKRKLHNNQIGE